MKGSGLPGGRVKVHVFEPSGRELWTVVGTMGEYWVDPYAGYCSCPAFYFAGARGRAGCQHLESAIKARSGGGAEVVRFGDSEYARLVAALVSDL